MGRLDNEKLKQSFLIALIFAIAYIVLVNLISYMTGLLGALTLYILFRGFYKKQVHDKGGKPWLWSIVILLIVTIAILVPAAIMGILVVEKITPIINNPKPLIDQWNIFYHNIHDLTGIDAIQINAEDIFNKLQKPVTSILLGMVGSTMLGATNMVILYFVLYFMFINGNAM